MPTLARPRKTIQRYLPAIEPLGTVDELGSGWGHLAFLLAKNYPSHSVRGYEISPLPWIASKLAQKIFYRKTRGLKLFRKDFFEENFENSSLIVCYLYPKGMGKLESKLQKEMRKGTFVLSYTFAFPTWKPKKIIQVNDLFCSKLYLYEKE